MEMEDWPRDDFAHSVLISTLTAADDGALLEALKQLPDLRIFEHADWEPLFKRFEVVLEGQNAPLIKEVLTATSLIFQSAPSAVKSYQSYSHLLKIIETTWDLEMLELGCDTLLLALESQKRAPLADKFLRLGNQWGDGWDMSLLDLSRVADAPSNEEPKQQFDNIVSKLRGNESNHSQLRIRILIGQASQGAAARQHLCSIRVKALQIMFYAHASHQRQDPVQSQGSQLLRRHCSPSGYVERNPSFLHQLVAFLRASPEGFERSLCATVNLFRFMDRVKPQMVMSQQNVGTTSMNRILRESIDTPLPRCQLELADAWLQLLCVCLPRKTESTHELVHAVINDLLHFLSSAQHLSLFPILCRVIKILGHVVTNANQNVIQLLRDRNCFEMLVTRLVQEIEKLSSMETLVDPPPEREHLAAYWVTVADVCRRQVLLRQIIEVTTQSFPGVITSQVQEPLLNATQQLLNNPSKFGYGAYAGAVSFLTQVFQDDPSCIPQMIENGIIPILITSMSSVTKEVIQTAPMVLATISLHEKGEAELVKAPLEALVFSLADVRMVTTWTHSENAGRLGGALDEILRNRSGMLPKILQLITDLFQALAQVGINLPVWTIESHEEVVFSDMLANVGYFLDSLLVNPDISPRIARNASCVEVLLSLMTSPCLPPCFLALVDKHPISTVMKPLTRQALLDNCLINKVQEAAQLLRVIGVWDTSDMKDALVQAVSVIDAVLRLYMPIYAKDVTGLQMGQLWTLAKAMMPCTHFIVLNYAKTNADRKESIEKPDALTYAAQLSSAYTYRGEGDKEERTARSAQADILKRLLSTWKSIFALIGRVTNTPSRRHRTHGPEGRQLVIFIAKALKDLYALDLSEENPSVIIRYYLGLNELATAALFDGNEKNDAVRPLTVDALFKLGGLTSLCKAVTYNINLLRSMEEHSPDVQLCAAVTMDSFLQLVEKLTSAKKMHAASMTNSLSRHASDDADVIPLVKKLQKFDAAMLLCSLQMHALQMLMPLWENPSLMLYLPTLSVQALVIIFKNLLTSKTGGNNAGAQRWLVQTTDIPVVLNQESQAQIAGTIRMGLHSSWDSPTLDAPVTPPLTPSGPAEPDADLSSIMDYVKQADVDNAIRDFAKNVVQRIESVGMVFGLRSWIELADFVLTLCQCASIRFDPTLEDLPVAEANLAMIIRQLSTRLSSLHAIYQDPSHGIYKEALQVGDTIRGSFGPLQGGPWRGNTADLNAVGVLTCCFSHLMSKCFDLTAKHLSVQPATEEGAEDTNTSATINMLVVLNTFLYNLNANATTSFEDRGFTVGLGHLALPSNCFSVLRTAPAWVVSVCLCAQLVLQSFGPTYDDRDNQQSKLAQIQKQLVTNCLDLLVRFPGIDGDTAFAVLQLLHSLTMVHANAVHLLQYDASPFYYVNCTEPFHGGGIGVILKLSKHAKFNGMLKLMTDICCFCLENDAELVHQIEQQVIYAFKEVEESSRQSHQSFITIPMKDVVRRVWGNSLGRALTRRVPQRLIEEAIHNVCSDASAIGASEIRALSLLPEKDRTRRRRSPSVSEEDVVFDKISQGLVNFFFDHLHAILHLAQEEDASPLALGCDGILFILCHLVSKYPTMTAYFSKPDLSPTKHTDIVMVKPAQLGASATYIPLPPFSPTASFHFLLRRVIPQLSLVAGSPTLTENRRSLKCVIQTLVACSHSRIDFRKRLLQEVALMLKRVDPKLSTSSPPKIRKVEQNPERFFSNVIAWTQLLSTLLLFKRPCANLWSLLRSSLTQLIDSMDLSHVAAPQACSGIMTVLEILTRPDVQGSKETTTGEHTEDTPMNNHVGEGQPQEAVRILTVDMIDNDNDDDDGSSSGDEQADSGTEYDDANYDHNDMNFDHNGMNYGMELGIGLNDVGADMDLDEPMEEGGGDDTYDDLVGAAMELDDEENEDYEFDNEMDVDGHDGPIDEGDDYGGYDGEEEVDFAPEWTSEYGFEVPQQFGENTLRRALEDGVQIYVAQQDDGHTTIHHHTAAVTTDDNFDGDFSTDLELPAHHPFLNPTGQPRPQRQWTTLLNVLGLPPRVMPPSDQFGSRHGAEQNASGTPDVALDDLTARLQQQLRGVLRVPERATAPQDTTQPGTEHAAEAEPQQVQVEVQVQDAIVDAVTEGIQTNSEQPVHVEVQVEVPESSAPLSEANAPNITVHVDVAINNDEAGPMDVDMEGQTSGGTTAPVEVSSTTAPVVAAEPSIPAEPVVETQETPPPLCEPAAASAAPATPSVVFDIPSLAVTGASLNIDQATLIRVINVDPEFLEALPSDLQNEVCVQAIQQAGGISGLRNVPEVAAACAAATTAAQSSTGEGQQPPTNGQEVVAAPRELAADGEISQDILDALPPDIRAEVLMQRQEQQAMAAAAQVSQGGPAEMDNASFFATLTPELRQEMLMTASDVVLQQLPPEMVAEANVLRGRGLNRRANLEAHRWVQRSGARALESGMRMFGGGAAHRLQRQAQRRYNVLGDRVLNPFNEMRTPHNPAMSKQAIFAALKKGSQPLVSVQELMQLCKLLYLQGQHPNDQFYNTSIAKTPLSGFFFNVSFSPQCLRPLLKRLLHVATENPKSITWDDGENPAVTSFALANGRALEILVDILTRIPCRQYFTNSINTLALILNCRLCESAPHTLLTLRCLKVLLCDDVDDETSAGAERPSTSCVEAQGASAPDSSTPVGSTITGAAPAAGSNSGINAVNSAPSAAEEQPQVAPTETPSDSAAPAASASGLSASGSGTEVGTTAAPHDSTSKGDKNVITAATLRRSLQRTAVGSLVQYLCNAPTHEHEKSVLLCTDIVSVLYQKSDEDNCAQLRQWIEEGLLADARHFVQKVSTSIHEDGLPHAALFLRLLHTLRHVFKEHDRVGSGPRLQEFLENAHAENLWRTLDSSLADKRSADDWSRHMPLIEAFFIVHNFDDDRKSSDHEEMEETVYSPRRDRLRSFCSRHAKSINHIVKQTPMLLTTSLQAVVKFSPNILDFQNKRNLFRQRLRAYRGDAKYETIRIHVRRSDIFIDSYHQLRHRTAEEMRGKLAVQFVGEDGMDAGGLTREWFETLAKEMFNPNYALFAPAGGRPSTFHPNALSYVNPDHLSFFAFVGRVVGKAVHDNHTLKAYFTMSLYKNLLRRKVQPQDLEALDPEYFKSLKWILQPNGTKGLDLTFSADTDTFGCYQVVNLKENGSQIAVTEDNKYEYVQLMCEHKMIHSVKQQLDLFMKGFHELVPTELINIFDDKELELLICGLPEIDLTDLRRNTEYHNYTEQSPQMKWFWKFLGEFTEEQKAWLLQFVTGTSQVPLEGFKALVGMRGPQKFSIHRAGGSTDRLPTAHTCFNQLDLPEYPTEEIFRQKLLQAVEEAHEGFGFI